MARRISLLIISLLLCSLCHSQVRYHTRILPEVLPKSLENVYHLVEITSGGWTLNTVIAGVDVRICPVYVGYVVQPNMDKYTDWPSVEEALERANRWFSAPKNTSGTSTKSLLYYSDKQVKVFVEIHPLFISGTLY